MDPAAWWARVHGVTKSRTGLSDWTATGPCWALFWLRERIPVRDQFFWRCFWKVAVSLERTIKPPASPSLFYKETEAQSDSVVTRTACPGLLILWGNYETFILSTQAWFSPGLEAWGWNHQVPVRAEWWGPRMAGFLPGIAPPSGHMLTRSLEEASAVSTGRFSTVPAHVGTTSLLPSWGWQRSKSWRWLWSTQATGWAQCLWGDKLADGHFAPWTDQELALPLVKHHK